MDEGAQRAVRQVRIVHLGVCAGVIVFLGIAVSMQKRLQQLELAESVLVGVLALVAACCGAAYVVVERGAASRVRAMQLRSPEASGDAAVATYRQLAIVRAGLIEGPCFLACAAYMATGRLLALGATVLGIVLLLSRIPSVEGFRQFMDRTRGA